MIVVTGATGHLGNVLVRQLLDRGEHVRVLVYENETVKSLDNLDVEKIPGDIRNLDSLEKAFNGADVVYHLAALVKTSPGYQSQLQAINVQGTQNVLQACKTNNVRRLIYSSSSRIFGNPPKGITINESMPIVPSKVPKGYIRSKAQATLEVLNATKHGIDAVIAVPTGIIGPYDFIPSLMGRMCIETSTSGRSFYVDGGYNYIDVRDAANGFISLAEKGSSGGELYLLSGEFCSDRQALNILSQELGIPEARYRIPPWLAYLAAYPTVLYHKISSGPDPPLTPGAIGDITSNSSFCCAKAQKELGFHARSIETSLTDAIRWFKKMEMIR